MIKYNDFHLPDSRVNIIFKFLTLDQNHDVLFELACEQALGGMERDHECRRN